MESKTNEPEPKDDKDSLKTLAMPELMKKLGATADGLTQAEATKRQAQYGPNQIEEKKTNEYLKFLSYFWGPIPWMIEAAVILSGLVRHWLDFFVILLLLCSNALVGFWEEHQAGNAIAALKARLAIKAKVKRDGKWQDPKASEVVPGDVIRLRLGDIVPADARLLDGDSIEVDQSALTGESLPVTAKPGGAVYSGSIIRQGEIDAIVYATGSNTYFGKTAQLVEEAHTVSHFQKAVMKIGDYLIILAVALVALILVFALFRGDKVLTTLEFCLVLLVAAIPVAMPTVLSVTMAVGARLLAKKEAIVTRLSAIEELAGVDVLCSDKTGTLTQNKLTLGDPFCIDGIAAANVILWAALASRAEDKDTIDLAVIGGVKDDKELKSCQVLHFMPFDPVHKRTEATVKGADGKQFFVAKGAPQVILQMATNAGEVKTAANKAILDFAGRGFRSLGVAKADEARQMEVCRHVALVRPAARGCQGNHRECHPNGRQNQNGDGRSNCHCPGNIERAWPGRQYPGRQRARRHQEEGVSAGNGGDRKGRRLRAGLPRAQVSYRRRVADLRPHRRHDWRWSKRRTCPEESRLRHRRLRRNRRSQSGSFNCLTHLRSLRDHRRNQRESPYLPAHE